MHIKQSFYEASAGEPHPLDSLKPWHWHWPLDYCAPAHRYGFAIPLLTSPVSICKSFDWVQSMPVPSAPATLSVAPPTSCETRRVRGLLDVQRTEVGKYNVSVGCPKSFARCTPAVAAHQKAWAWAWQPIRKLGPGRGSPSESLGLGVTQPRSMVSPQYLEFHRYRSPYVWPHL